MSRLDMHARVTDSSPATSPGTGFQSFASSRSMAATSTGLDVAGIGCGAAVKRLSPWAGPPRSACRLRAVPRAGAVLRQLACAALLPGVEDALHPGPRGFDGVAADEQGGIPGHHVEQQALVGFRRLLAEGGAVTEVHLHGI